MKRCFLALGFAVLLRSGSALAASVPFTLPPGEPAVAWAGALSMGGFVAGPAASGPGAEVRVVGAGWELRVRDDEGGVHVVTVARPVSAAGREDLVWLARSLVHPGGSRTDPVAALLAASQETPSPVAATPVAPAAVPTAPPSVTTPPSAAVPAAGASPRSSVPPRAVGPTPARGAPRPLPVAAPPVAAVPSAAVPSAAVSSAVPPVAVPPSAAPPIAALPSADSLLAGALPAAPAMVEPAGAAPAGVLPSVGAGLVVAPLGPAAPVNGAPAGQTLPPPDGLTPAAAAETAGTAVSATAARPPLTPETTTSVAPIAGPGSRPHVEAGLSAGPGLRAGLPVFPNAALRVDVVGRRGFRAVGSVAGPGGASPTALDEGRFWEGSVGAGVGWEGHDRWASGLSAGAGIAFPTLVRPGQTDTMHPTPQVWSTPRVRWQAARGWALVAEVPVGADLTSVHFVDAGLDVGSISAWWWRPGIGLVVGGP